MASGVIAGLLARSHALSPSLTIPAGVLKEIDDADVPFFMAGILLPHAVCTLLILARVVSRAWVLRKWFIDDTLIVLSWLFSTALCIVYGITATTPSLLGAPPDEAALKDANPYIMRTYLGLIYYQLCLCFTKLSILAFYLRVFVARQKERYLVWATVAFVILYGAPMLLMSFLQCHPAPGQFFGQPMVCFGFPDLLISSASLHTATDAWLILMVIPCVMKLELPRRQKFALGLVMSLGVFVIVASMVRLHLSLHLHYRPNSAAIRNTLRFFVMTVLECDTALICASAPTLRPLLAKLFPGLVNTAKKRPLQATDGQSFDLTSLTYHGYPWSASSTPFTRSRNPSVVSHLNKTRVPVPPVPVLTMAQRTPTTLSPGNMIAGTPPPRPPRTRDRHWGNDGKPMSDETWAMKRSSSIYSQDSAYSRDPAESCEGFGDDDLERQGVILKTMRVSLHSEYVAQTGFDHVGRTKPLKINRMSPASGLSGDTCVADRSSSSTKNESIDGALMCRLPKEECNGKPEVPPRSPLRNSQR
ncbi:hypothetical protein CTA2_3867 [Colletotrichum tanaceti]|uniref:Rhodopsin domain-containing protein n=1 Tax=Colletotrichum tanaceti TaxID=1306861 RepID=A0A4U6XA20_9PEZI|nr:hypothetical protein CTA2_3867 [Colletotrichum tanaceti]TKW52335.1 hypothetical protein CTA1_7255 [Colletotrichum tanaceti]